MSKPIIRKVAVLGAGVMGAQIAAHLVNAGVPVLLFDLPADSGPTQAVAARAIDNLKRLRPAPLGVADDAGRLQPADYGHDLDKLGECDLVIEAIAERLDWKHDLYRKVAGALKPDAIFASNTSGLSIAALAEGLPPALKSRFCGVHFFNPPRYMHLVELIPTPETRPDLVDALETFLTSVTGKGVVRAKDTPNFIANRVGVFAILAVIAEAEKFGLGYDTVDDLTGARLGRAKSATFRTADVVGLDTMAHVIATMRDQLAGDPFFPLYGTPPALAALVGKGALGQKTGAGFYRKTGKTIAVLDPATGDYVESTGKADELVGRILKRPPAERFKLLRESTHPQARFLWAIFRDVFHYVAVHLEAIADSARDIDFALRWGFGWSEGPFESWQAAGWTQIAQWVAEDIQAGRALSPAPLPDWVFSGPVALHGGVHSAAGSWSPARRMFTARSTLPVYERQMFRAPLFGGAGPAPATHGETVFETDALRAWRDPAVAPGVLIATFKTKMNTLSAAVLDGLHRAIEVAESDFDALVVWQAASLSSGPGAVFSAGADLDEALPVVMSGGANGLEPMVARFQATMMRIKYAQVPVVAALAGLALGGGCELALHCARRVACFETYIGLVEAGVGLVPAGGGLKEMTLRAAQRAAQGGSPRLLLNALARPFENAAMAKVSGSALEARAMGYLEPSDPIVFNPHELLATALREAATLAHAGYRPPFPGAGIAVAGRSGVATLRAQLVNLRDGRMISAHDFAIAEHIAYVLCGGAVEDGSLVDEAWLLQLERRAFIALVGMRKTQERIMGMLQTGKPVRN